MKLSTYKVISRTSNKFPLDSPFKQTTSPGLKIFDLGFNVLIEWNKDFNP